MKKIKIAVVRIKIALVTVIVMLAMRIIMEILIVRRTLQRSKLITLSSAD